jgi:hypothetical protein
MYRVVIEAKQEHSENSKSPSKVRLIWRQPSMECTKYVPPVGVQRWVYMSPCTKEGGSVSSLLYVGSHSLYYLVMNYTLNYKSKR